MGSQRCPMGTHRTDFAPQAPRRWSRSSLAGYAWGTQWNPVGLRYRGAVARAATEISPVPDLPSPLPAVGARRQTGKNIARASRGVTGSRQAQAGGGFHRRLLHGSKKKALPSGPPSAARGQKSSLSPMITVFLSPLLWKALRHTNADWWKEFSAIVSWTSSRRG